MPVLDRWALGYQFLEFYLLFVSMYIKILLTLSYFSSLGMGSEGIRRV